MLLSLSLCSFLLGQLLLEWWPLEQQRRDAHRFLPTHKTLGQPSHTHGYTGTGAGHLRRSRPAGRRPPSSRGSTRHRTRRFRRCLVSAVVSGGAPNPSAVVVAVVAEGELLGDAAASNPAPAPDSTSTPSSAALPLPASATHADPRPPRPQFAGSPAYMATPGPVSSSAPSFSYNVVPWVPPPLQVGSGTTPHQPSSSLVGVLSFAASDMSVHAAMFLSMITCLVL
jgi:hypothetical protein